MNGNRRARRRTSLAHAPVRSARAQRGSPRGRRSERSSPIPSHTGRARLKRLVAVARFRGPSRRTAPPRRRALSMIVVPAARSLGPHTTTSMPRMRGHVQGRGGHRERQRARMIGPGQHELPRSRHAEVVERLPVRERLAGMVHRGFEVDRAASRHSAAIGAEAVRRGRPRGRVPSAKRADAERVAVRREHRDRLAHVLRRRAVHVDAAARLELPVPWPGVITNDDPPSRAMPACIEASVRSDGFRNRARARLPASARAPGARCSRRRARAASDCSCGSSRSRSMKLLHDA